jgi:hypothetical protein
MKASTSRIITALALIFALLPFGVQAQGRKTGAILDTAAYAKVPYKSNLVRGLYDLPAKASVKQWAPYAGDQGQYGTCTAWSGAYAATTILYAKLNGMTDRAAITRGAFSPGFVFRLSFGDQFPGCDSGQAIPYILKVIEKSGVPPLSDLDSLCPSSIPLSSYEKARPFSILGFTRLASPEDGKPMILQKVKKAVAEGKPVVVGMFVDDAPGTGCFATLTRDFIWTPDRSVEPTRGHAMVVVSYDDAYGGGAFELQNSWGRDYGNDGFFWMRYNDFVEYLGESYELLENPGMAHPGGSELAGALSIRKADGGVPAVGWTGSQYAVREDFPSGARFRLYLDNNEPAFVYLVGVDTAWTTYRLFPSDDSMSPALTYKRNEVALPGEDLYIQTDQNPGKESMVVLYSLRELDLAKIEKGIEMGSGSLPERLQAALGPALVPFAQVKYEKDRMAFTAQGGSDGVVALIVTLNHTP